MDYAQKVIHASMALFLMTRPFRPRRVPKGHDMGLNLLHMVSSHPKSGSLIFHQTAHNF